MALVFYNAIKNKIEIMEPEIDYSIWYDKNECLQKMKLTVVIHAEKTGYTFLGFLNTNHK